MISPVSIGGFSPNFCHWCILDKDELFRFGGQKVKVALSRRRRPTLDAAVQFKCLFQLLPCSYLQDHFSSSFVWKVEGFSFSF